MGELCLTPWATFASSLTEQQFRFENLTEDRRTVKFLSLSISFLVVSFALIDLMFQGVTRVSLALLLARFVILVSTAMLLFRLRGPIAPQPFDRWLIGWITVVVCLALYSLSMRPPQQVVPMGILMLLMISLLVPMRFTFQAGTATATCLALMALVVTKKPANSAIATGLTALVATLGVGLVSSRALHRTRRESFAARLVEQKTVSKLEAALAAVKQLQGIVPICSACKKIRQEDSTWMVLEEYISARSEARFSHGLCPECVPKFH